jgi:nicotinamide-nucleotide adenylyltransferase
MKNPLAFGAGVRALVVGRFQPFHKGHQALIQRALERSVNVAVAVGSTNAKSGPRNPFTFEERRAMVQAVFPGIEVVPVPDIHDATRWVDHCLSITGPVDLVYGNDEATLALFEQARVPVERPGLVERGRYEATRIRQLMVEDDPEWRKLVPPAVAALLQEWKAPQRLLRMDLLA